MYERTVCRSGSILLSSLLTVLRSLVDYLLQIIRLRFAFVERTVRRTHCMYERTVCRSGSVLLSSSLIVLLWSPIGLLRQKLRV